MIFVFVFFFLSFFFQYILSLIIYRNEYNHVTATYFLLAERKLRAQRQDTARRARSVKRPQQGKPGFHPEVCLNWFLILMVNLLKTLKYCQDNTEQFLVGFLSLSLNKALLLIPLSLSLITYTNETYFQVKTSPSSVVESLLSPQETKKVNQTNQRHGFR